MNQSIYQQICAHTKDGVLDGGFFPQDADKSDVPIRFAPGAMDGICIYHIGLPPLDEEGTKEMVAALEAASDGRISDADQMFAEWTKKHRAIQSVDDMQRYICQHDDTLNLKNLVSTGANMILESVHVECVKIGLGILELFSLPLAEVKEMIRQVGLCDEFTIFAIWNMQKWDNANDEIFTLARKVHGWGRIHAIERLQPDTAEIRHWLLTEGTVNDVMGAYSALTCWEQSGAEEILYGSPTEEEYRGIVRLIASLLHEGPVTGLSALKNPKKVLLRFLEVSGSFNRTNEDIEVIRHIKHRAANKKAPVPDVATACEQLLRT